MSLITESLKKGGFEWSHFAQKAFEKVKALMTETPILALLDFENLFVVECDASLLGIGAVLSQDGRLVVRSKWTLDDIIRLMT